MLEEKYLKSPLGEDEKAKKKRLKREEDRRKKLAEEAAEAVLLCKKLGHQAVTHPGSPSVLKNLDGKCMRENGQLSTR